MNTAAFSSVLLVCLSVVCAVDGVEKSSCCSVRNQSGLKAADAQLDRYSQTILQPQFSWGRQMGGPHDDFGKSIGVDASGHTYVGGWTNGQLGENSFGGYDCVVIKNDPAGNTVWVSQFGSSEDEQIEEIAVDEEGFVVVTGWTKGRMSGDAAGEHDGFVAKLDPQGQRLWTQQFGTAADDKAHFVVLDKEGCIYVVGYTAGDFAGENEGKRDAFLLKLGAAGELIFKTQFGSALTDIGHGVAIEDEGSVYVSGVTGAYWDEPNFHDQDVMLAKLDAYGELIWNKTMGTAKADTALPVVLNSNGNLLVGGSTAGDFGGKQVGQGDAFIGEFSPTGEMLWVQQFGRGKWDCVMNIEFANDGSGDFFVSGCQNWNQCEGYVRRYSPSGSLIWSDEFGSNEGQGSTCGKDVAVDLKGNIYHTGGTNSGMFRKNEGEQDIYVIKMMEH